MSNKSKSEQLIRSVLFGLIENLRNWLTMQLFRYAQFETNSHTHKHITINSLTGLAQETQFTSSPEVDTKSSEEASKFSIIK